MGMSRSATLSIGFLMLRRGMTVEQALTQVRQHRGVRPNNGFLSQLIELDNRIRSEAAAASLISEQQEQEQIMSTM